MTTEVSCVHSLKAEEEQALSLLTPEAVRERCHEIYRAGQAGQLHYFILQEDLLESAAKFVVETIRSNYPKLDIPYHSRWRHFVLGNYDRWHALRQELEAREGREETARIAIDLAVVSVLLDAGAGPAWSYRIRDPNGREWRLERSEGLAQASFDAFTSGLFSSERGIPWRCDAKALMALKTEDLAQAFQHSGDNSLIGLEGRCELLRALGRSMTLKPDFFPGPQPRIGGLFDSLQAKADSGRLCARQILIAVLQALEGIWPGRIMLGEWNLGDTWRHSLISRDDATNGLVPFHKLSQWLAYSMIEPCEWAGLQVTGIDALTGLAEYRNGGLFFDLKVIVPKTPDLAETTFTPDEEAIVEWRALTVALLDQLAPIVREELGLNNEEFPLAKLLEGGTWAAGRRIARQFRNDAGPPLKVKSDGALF